MTSYPNQKHYTINRINPVTEKKQYLSITTENLAAASRNLSGEIAFKFYLYLCSNQDGYSFHYSPQHFANIYGVSLDSARRADEKLKEAGYLVPSADRKNGYDFYEVPQEAEPELEIELPEEEKRLAKTKQGTETPITYSQLYQIYKDKHPEEVIKKVWNSLEVWH